MESKVQDPRSVLVDGRWLGIGGPGRITEHLLKGLAELEPPGDWIVWGGAEAADLVWPGARWIPSRHHPHRWFGQREIPGPRTLKADAAFFPHQMRPGWRIASAEVTIIHDTIPFRYPPRRSLAPAMRYYMRHMARLTDVVCTGSEFSRQCLMRDLGVPSHRILIASDPIDHVAADRVRSHRATTPVEALAVYVGADLPHKNIDRLIAAFARTRFQAGGGRLALIGMDPHSLERLVLIARGVGAAIDPMGRIPQVELEAVLARAAVLVQPSLEEGFGLPVAEAMASGVPVAVSSGGSLPEITQGRVPTFDPFDTDAMARAIDQATTSPAVASPTWATPLDFARDAHQAILRAHRADPDEGRDVGRLR